MEIFQDQTKKDNYMGLNNGSKAFNLPTVFNTNVGITPPNYLYISDISEWSVPPYPSSSEATNAIIKTYSEYNLSPTITDILMLGPNFLGCLPVQATCAGTGNALFTTPGIVNALGFYFFVPWVITD